MSAHRSSYELREVAARALPCGPVAGLVTAPGSVTLELPGRGRVIVAGDHVVVEAVSPAAGAALYAELRTWINGQRWRQAGLLVFGGACVEIGGRAVLLASRPRNGASFAALGLVRTGGRLVSDGVTAVRPALPEFGAEGLDAEGFDAGAFVALPGRVPIELDARAIAPGSELPVAPAGTGAPRVLLEVAHTTVETPIAAVVILVARLNLSEVAVAPADADTAPARLRTTAVRDLSRSDRSPGRLADLVGAVPVTTLLLPVGPSTPSALADAVLDTVGLVGRAVTTATTTERVARGRTVWCASYPKSGNTWLRALLTAHAAGGAVDINDLDGGDQPGAHATLFDLLGLGVSGMARNDVERLGRLTTQLISDAADAPVFRKVHDGYGPACDGVPRFLPEHTRLVAYIVRDPRAVAVSWAHHLNVSHEAAVELMRTRPDPSDFGSPWLPGVSGYPLGTWSEHVESWLDQRDLPVEIVRYEDVVADPAAGLRRVLEAADADVHPHALQAAVEACSFEALAVQEILGGFIEAPRADRAFFRRGEAASWRQELSPQLAASIERDHGAVIERLGYPKGGGR